MVFAVFITTFPLLLAILGMALGVRESGIKMQRNKNNKIISIIITTQCYLVKILIGPQIWDFFLKKVTTQFVFI